jgi:hypothetical protein
MFLPALYLKKWRRQMQDCKMGWQVFLPVLYFKKMALVDAGSLQDGLTGAQRPRRWPPAANGQRCE